MIQIRQEPPNHLRHPAYPPSFRKTRMHAQNNEDIDELDAFAYTAVNSSHRPVLKLAYYQAHVVAGDEEVSMNVQRAKEELWRVPLEFAAHAVIGTVIFGIIAMAAVVLDRMVHTLEANGTGRVIILGLTVAECGLLGTDLGLFGVFLWRTAALTTPQAMKFLRRCERRARRLRLRHTCSGQIWLYSMDIDRQRSLNGSLSDY